MSNLICTLKDALLPRDHEKGLVVSADIGMNDRGNEKRGTIHFVFVGNTSVWFAYCESLSRWDDIPIERWENTSNHDSCWRTDGVNQPLAKLYFDWARELNPHKAPRNIEQFCTLGVLLSSPWEKVKVKHERLGDNSQYWRKIISIERGW